MKSFYSILQVPIRPAGQEHLNIGLLFIDERESYFKFSLQKLNLLKKLIPDNSYNLLRSYLFGMSEKINTENDSLRTRFRNTDFVNYLSNYNNNLITFSKPTPIDLEVNEKTFQTLFEKFVFTYEHETLREEAISHPVSVKNQLEYTLYPRIKGRVNFNQVLTTKEIPTLLVPSVKVNFIGQNNIPVAGQGVDFEKSPVQITDSVSRLISLIKAFEMEGKHGQYYVIGKEPDKAIYAEQHDNWVHLRDSGLIQFVDISEIEIVSNYIETHNVKPFVG